MRLLNPVKMYGVLDCIDEEGADVVTGVLTERVRRLLLEEVKTLTWRRSTDVVEPTMVRQDYRVITHFHETSLFRTVSRELQERLMQLFHESATLFPAARELRFNELRVQRYEAGSAGISPHRDHACCKILVALFILEDGGRFCLCRDRDGCKPLDPRPLAAKAGDLILMKAPGFFEQTGPAAQPMHFVDSVERRRTTFGLRFIP